SVEADPQGPAVETSARSVPSATLTIERVAGPRTSRGAPLLSRRPRPARWARRYAAPPARNHHDRAAARDNDCCIASRLLSHPQETHPRAHRAREAWLRCRDAQARCRSSWAALTTMEGRRPNRPRAFARGVAAGARR